MSDRPRFLDEPIKPVVSPPVATPSIAVDRRGWVEGMAGAEGPVRHDAVVPLPAAPAQAGPRALTAGAAALLVLILGVAGFELINFVGAQFERATWLGVLTAAVLGPAAAVFGWSVAREWRGYASLGATDRLWRGLASDDVAVAKQHAAVWLRAIGASPDMQQVAATVVDAATLRGLLRAVPLVELDRRTTAAGRAAAFEVLAATAVSPWPGLDGAIVVWRGLRLVRQVAEIHGLRPGIAGTLRLFRRVTLDAGAVAATDLAVAALAEAVLSSPVGGALAGQAAGSAVAARRMLRLAFAVAQSCRPL